MPRFFKYAAVTLPTFLFDLGILVTLTQVFHVQYVLAAGTAFVIATSLNYVLSRRFVFLGTHRSLSLGYVYFFMIAGAGLLTVTTGMYVFVGLLHFNYIVSRVGIALVEGVWNYLMNLYVNFRVAGKTQSSL